MEDRAPIFVCEDCGATGVDIPEWTDDQTLITCRVCGRTIGTIRFILEVLRAALEEDGNDL